MDVLKVLIVDDSPVVLRQLKMMLEQLGHTVVGMVTTGRKAIAAYQEFRPDLVTMDLTMPDMDGMEATREIVALDHDANIIIISSHGQEKMKLDSLRSGASGYLQKPFEARDVADAIEKSLTRKALKRKSATVA